MAEAAARKILVNIFNSFHLLKIQPMSFDAALTGFGFGTGGVVDSIETGTLFSF